mmetsp:Transcript_63086/g.117368  ORF Transcript_63086/g.117368 Transcript_63086/m.117368 type:complete len:216 (+) Transcript_63086:254-901(+)
MMRRRHQWKLSGPARQIMCLAHIAAAAAWFLEMLPQPVQLPQAALAVWALPPHLGQEVSSAQKCGLAMKPAHARSHCAASMSACHTTHHAKHLMVQCFPCFMSLPQRTSIQSKFPQAALVCQPHQCQTRDLLRERLNLQMRPPHPGWKKRTGPSSLHSCRRHCSVRNTLGCSSSLLESRCCSGLTLRSVKHAFTSGPSCTSCAMVWRTTSLVTGH